ncbi:hypothetical protein PQR72_21645 [Paraburkholderia madseniana]|uniref:hypothetical protein n=1 Tax=Paraburkholderia madseniana TaxID=2599607 RepID=UPI0015C523FD|nr:hypothetical protein [Paraburkholderia madseniana]NPT66762.1 hypothetical protein [Paraburkholderia madseniana]
MIHAAARQRQMVALDGKTARRATPIAVISVRSMMPPYGIDVGVVLGQMCMANKSNRITAIPELFDPSTGFPSGRRKQHGLGTQHDLWRKSVPCESRDYGAKLRNAVPYLIESAQARYKHKRRTENTPPKVSANGSVSRHSLIGL